MKKLLLTSTLIIGCSLYVAAQDPWVNVVNSGFDNSSNSEINALHVFKGQIYAGTGTYTGSVFRSSTGNAGSWSSVFSDPNYSSVDAINSTTQGGGYIYISGYSEGSDIPRIFNSPDGVTWTPYYNANNYNGMPFIIPFNGVGTADSMYVVLNSYFGDAIIKSAYNSNDPDNLSHAWDTVLDFSIVSPYMNIQSMAEYNNKLYLGTNNGGTLWSSADGHSWDQNIHAGMGFGDGMNTGITALASYGGYLYAGTSNNSSGAQIWRSNDDTTWTMVTQISGASSISSLKDVSGTLWVTVAYNYGLGKVLRSTDGLTFSTSDATGFGVANISGQNAKVEAFGNNLYWGGEDYYAAKALTTTTDPGAQVWRLCLVTPPAVNLGADQVVCVGTSVTFDAGAGAVSYLWSDSTTTQTLTTSVPGTYTVTILGINGCSNSDMVTLSDMPAPTSYVASPYPFTTTYLCKNDTLGISTYSSSNARISQPPIHKPTNMPVYDYLTYYDTIPVSLPGVTDIAGIALSDMIIDSLYHTFDGDVQLTLFAPNGDSVHLTTGNGSGSDNFIATDFTMSALNSITSGTGPFTGAYLPEDPFSNFTGSVNGNWILRAYDQAGGDTGFVKGWTLHFAQSDTNLVYSWSPATGLSASNVPMVNAHPTSTTTYSLTVTDILGCKAVDTVKINVPSVHIIASNDSICHGSSTNLYGVQNFAFSPFWNPDPTLSGTVGDTVIASPLVNTTYYIHDTSVGCVIMDSIKIYADPAFSATAGPSQSICYADTAILNATGTGGTSPYIYTWNDGTTLYHNQNQPVAVLSNITYTLSVTDQFHCSQGGSTDITVKPSTDIYGHVNYSGGSVIHGTVVIYKDLHIYTQFDTVQVQTLSATGDYHFTSINHGDYLIKVFSDTVIYPTLDPTYYGNKWAWDSATVVVHNCDLSDTANITMIEEIGTGATGPGFLRGRITEDVGFGRSPGDPVPGIDVKLGKNPGGSMFISTTTSPLSAADNGGYYYFNNIPLNAPGQYYTVYVDIPGLERDSSYNVVLDSVNNQYVYLDYIVDSTSINIVPGAGTGVSNPSMATQTKFNVYPNPFKNTTNIVYSITNDATVSLNVYDVLGTKIKTLASGKQSAGDYKYSLNDQNDLNSGVYFISLTINGKTTTQRVIVLE